MPSLHISLFGFPVVQYGREPIKVDTRKSIALLAYLVGNQRPVSRDKLLTLFWMDYNDTKARASLRRTLSVTRKALNKEWLEVTDHTIALKTEGDCFVDVIEFQRHLANVAIHQHINNVCDACINELVQAIVLYKNDFLTGFTLKDSPQFDEWQSFMTESLRQDFLDAVNTLVNWYTESGNYEQAIKYTLLWKHHDIYEDAPYRHLMKLYAWSNQHNKALQIYQEFANFLEEEMGVPPLEETIYTYETILNNELKIPIIQGTSEISPDINPSRLFFPSSTKPFIGREIEIKQIAIYLQDAHKRLVTVVGIGGIGKTRLVIEVANQYEHLYEDGICYIELDGKTTQDELVAQLGSVLHLQFYSGKSHLEQIYDHLRHKKILLVFDNFELYTSDSRFISNLLEQTRYLKLLIATQKVLDIQEEWNVPISGLAHQPNTETFSNDAIELFHLYAKRADPYYKAKAELASVQQICQLLEGMPLAIELSATQIILFNSEEIFKEISENIDFLKASYSNTPTRHMNLRAVFNYLWQYMQLELQTSLLELSIFEGSFDRKAALAVTSTTAQQLTKLQRQGLVNQQQQRYAIPYSLRTFLEENTEHVAELKKRHSQYYAQFVFQQDLEGSQQKQCMEQMEINFSNITQGWHYAIEAYAFPVIYEYVENLFLFFTTAGRFSEGKAFFELAVETYQTVFTRDSRVISLIAKLKSRLGCFHNQLGSRDIAKQLFEENLGIHETVEDWAEVSLSLSHLAVTYWFEGQFDKAQQYLKDGLELAEEINHNSLRARCLNNLGLLANSQKHYSEAITYLEKSFSIYVQQGNKRFQSYNLNNLGMAYEGQGDLEKAYELFKRSYDMKKEVGDIWGCATSLINLGKLDYHNQDNQDAANCMGQALDISQHVQKFGAMAHILQWLGKIWLQDGQLEKSRSYFWEALRLSIEQETHSRTFYILKDLAIIYCELGLLSQCEQIIITMEHSRSLVANLDQEIEDFLANYKKSILLNIDNEIAKTLIELYNLLTLGKTNIITAVEHNEYRPVTIS